MYITLNDLKGYKGIPIEAMKDDALLLKKIRDAQAFIESPAGSNRRFEATEETRYFHADNDRRGRDLIIEDQDLWEITEIINGDGEIIDERQYKLYPKGGRAIGKIRLRQMIRDNDEVYPTTWKRDEDDEPEDAISVSGSWGFTKEPPDNIKFACKRLAAWLYDQKDTSSEPQNPIVTSSGVIIMPSAVPKDIMAILRPYRRRM